MNKHEVSESKYAGMIEEIRSIYKKHGADLFHEADEYGINKFYPSKNGDIEFVFYWHGISKVYTPEGYITPLGSYSHSGTMDEKVVMDELIERFGLVLVSDFQPTDWRKGERWITYKVAKERG